METIHFRNPRLGLIPFPGYRSETPGLVVHKTPVFDENGQAVPCRPHYYGGAWTITHEPTGMKIRTAKTKRDAMRFCRAMGELADWSVESMDRQIVADPQLGYKVLALS